MGQKYIKLSEYASINRIKYRAAWNRFNNGKIKNAFIDEYGKILIPINDDSNVINCVCYARVSSNDRKDSLVSQQKRLEEFANLKGFNVIKSYKEIASGMNDNRSELNKILNSDDWKYLIVENKDRLTRFGFNYIKTLLEKNNKGIIIINQTDDDKQDLMKDLISVIYSFSARMYGLRRRKNKEEIIKFIES